MKLRFLMLVPIAALAACGGGSENETAEANQAEAAPAEDASRSIGDALAESPDHARFMQAVESAGLTETLRGAGPYTVFAPTNSAFEGGPAAGDGAAALELLSYHIVPGAVTREDLVRAVQSGETGRAELATIAGDTISVAREGEALVLTDASGTQARITEADLVRSNGVAHTIDAVLRPGD